MNERDEQEIETRLRAAFLARSELVTHQRLRPGVPPNAHTAAAKQAKRRGWSLSWRAALLPVSVAAALAGGVFIGANLPEGGGGSQGAVSPGGVGGTSTVVPTATASLTGGVPASSGATALGSTPTNQPTASPASPASPTASFEVVTVAGLTVARPADWKLTKLDDGSACLQPQSYEAPDKSATLPCGVDALWIQSGVAATAWPISAAKDKEGWWPKAGSASGPNPNPSAGSTSGSASTPTSTPGSTPAQSSIPCPAAKPSAKNSVKSSATLRTDAAYPLSGTATADYREWTVTCADGSGVLPELWQVKGTKTIAITAISVNPRYDGALLGIVASMRPVNG